MPQHHSPEIGPAGAHLVDDGGEARKNLLVVGLVDEVGHTLTTNSGLFGMITNGAREDDDGTTTRMHGPLISVSDRQRIGSQSEPVVIRPFREHTPMVAGLRGTTRVPAREHMRANDH